MAVQTDFRLPVRPFFLSEHHAKERRYDYRIRNERNTIDQKGVIMSNEEKKLDRKAYNWVTIIETSVFPPTIGAANLLIARALDRIPVLKAEITRTETSPDRIMEDFFGISAELYEKGIVSESGVSVGGDPRFYLQNVLSGKCGKAIFFPNISGIVIRVNSPDWLTDDSRLYIGPDDLQAVREALPARNISDLHPVVFSAIADNVAEAYQYYKDDEDNSNPEIWADYWIADEGRPTWFDLISPKADEVFAMARLISRVLFAPFGELLKLGGFTKEKFCREFMVSRRTVEDWIYQQKSCRVYIRLMAAEAMGIFHRRHDA